MSDTPRFLLVGTRAPPINGQSIAFGMLLQGFVSTNTAVDVIDISERTGRRDRDFSFARVVQVLRLAISVWRACRSARLAYLTIAQSRWGFIRDALLIWTASLARRPIVLHLHGGNYAGFFASEIPLLRVVIRKTLRRAARIIVLSGALRHDFEFLGADRAGSIRVVPNGCPVPLRPPRKAPLEKVQLLYLSNLLLQKGYLDCIDALVEVRRRLPGWNIKLVLAGSFMLGEDEYATPLEMERALRKHIRYLGLEDGVEIAGVIDGDRKDVLLRDSDIFVLPTYYRNEGQPISLLEAMASGLPSIVTAWRGIAEIVTHEVNGLIVPSQDALAIADAVVRLCENPSLYEALSVASTRDAAQYSPANHVAAVKSVLDECLGVSPVSTAGP